jgi:hypothetical protein
MKIIRDIHPWGCKGCKLSVDNKSRFKGYLLIFLGKNTHTSFESLKVNYKYGNFSTENYQLKPQK